MCPIIYINNFPVPMYALCVLIGYIAGIITLIIITSNTVYSKKFILFSSLISVIGLFVGAKLMYMISLIPDIIHSPAFYTLNTADKLFYLLGGYVFYGGMAGAIAIICMLCIQFDYSVSDYCSYVIRVVPLIHGFGRIGCLMGGCCYGIKYDGPLHIVMSDNIARFPVQLVETLLLFMLAAFLIFKKTHSKNSSTIIYYLTIYPSMRFLLEFLRGDRIRGIFLGLSTSQWISLLILVCMIIYCHYRHHRLRHRLHHRQYH